MESIENEANLEAGVHDFLISEFCNHPASPFRGDSFVVANTARRGPHMGRWTRPDLTLVALQKLSIRKRIECEIITFEIKREEYGDITAVFEAVAHTRFAHYAYVAWHFPEASQKWKSFEEIKNNCHAHGIGLITFSEPFTLTSYKIIITPERKNPHPYDVDQFISNMPCEEKNEIMSKIRELECQL